MIPAILIVSIWIKKKDLEEHEFKRFHFTARMDRYNHDMGGEDTDDTDDFPLIGSFGSYSPQYRKHNSSLVQINLPQQISLDESINTSSGSGTASPISSNLSQNANASQNTPNSSIGKIISTPQLRKLDVSLKC